MYSPAASAGQSSESFESSMTSSESLNSRLMPRATDIGDEELVFRSNSSRSKTSQNQSYMASISTGQKARNTLSASMSRMGQQPTGSRSASSSSVSVNQQPSSSGRSVSNSAGQNGSMGRASGSRVPGRASNGLSPKGGAANGSSAEYADKVSPGDGGKRRPSGAGGGHSRKPSIDARGFLRALNDLFFAKFCVEELFYREYREQLVKRIQESTYRYDPKDLHDILDDVSEACKSTRLNLDAVSQWRLNYFTRDQSASVIDHVFLMNANVMTYDAKYSNACLDVFCADPLCCEIHAGRVTEEDKAKAFRRVLNMVLNEALRVRLIGKEQKIGIRQRLVKGVFAADDRVNAIREISVLVMLAQDERHRELITYGLNAFGQAWVQPDTSVADADEDCNLDPDMVYRKALGAINNAYLESILDVRRLGMSISVDEVGKLRDLWARNSTKVPGGRVVTLPMLLHLLVHCSEGELQEALPQAGVSVAAMAKANATPGSDASGLGGRIEQVEDAALQIVQNLGLAWELGDNPPRDLRQFCMVLLLDLGSVLSKFLVPEAPQSSPGASSSDTAVAADSDAFEIGTVEDGLFARWWEVCEAIVRFERTHRRFYTALLMTYIKTSSEKLLAQKADFDPELFLTMIAELLTEYRKRRPDYDAVVLTPDGRLSSMTAQAATPGSNDALPGIRVLDRRTREDIGSEFDRLFAWVDQQLPASNRVRSLCRATSPKSSRTPSWQQMSGNGSLNSMDKLRSSSSASIGYSSSSNGNRVPSQLPPLPVNTQPTSTR
ncbi:hypothetical protein BX661DRAFT_201066 [Kickxella alabastrina]|uniref:uncharacterized protein n=1 Tax=Kickxella alabastrina TaxID=61397 RepID=UPI00221EE402|nr:uncharacterized protein BX661DRAFT_201066 [Kickxella alabastrina]KAI7820202.1 hypothetical protein BX661DRAFT_201066 [Kickxella alabastrina]